MKIIFILLILLISCSKDKKAYDSAVKYKTGSKEELMIIDHGPKGEASGDVSQLRITFNKRMRVLGKEKDVTPYFSVSPAVKCKFKWVSETTVACNFDGKLKRGTEYNVSFKKGVSSFEGKVLNSDYSYTFKTSPPILLSSTANKVKRLPKGYLKFDIPIIKEKLKTKLICGQKEYPVYIDLTEGQTNQYELSLNPKELSFPLGRCQFQVKGSYVSSEGPGETTADLEFSADPPKTGNEDTDRLSQVFYSINCRNNGWYNKRLGNKKVCAVEGPANFQFRNSIDKSIQVEVIPQVADLEVKVNYNTVAVYGRFESGKLYDFRFPVGSGVFAETIVSLEFVDIPPEASFRYDRVVIEKTGPHQIPVQSKNIESFEVKYDQFTTPDEIAKNHYKKGRYDSLKDTNFENAKTKEFFTPPVGLNIGNIYPLEVDEYGTKSGGTYIFKVKSKKVKPEILESHRKILESRNHERAYTPFKFERFIQAQVTDIGLQVKKGYLNTLVWVFDIPSGMPLANSKVFAYSGSPLAPIEKETDNNGLVIFEQKNYDLFIATNKEDISFVSTKGRFNRGISYWDFKVPYSKVTDNSNFIVESIPDRPIYKPGEKVSLKFYIRKWDLLNLNYVHPKIDSIKVKITNPRGEKVKEERLKLSEFSTASINFELKKDAKLGDYNIQAIVNERDNFFTKGFKVQEYKLSPFKIEAKLDKKLYTNNDQIKFSGKSSYFFGGPYKDASGVFVVNFKHKVYRPKNESFSQYRFHDSNNYDYYDYFYGGVSTNSQELLREDFTTDKKGEFSTSTGTQAIYNSYLAGTISAMAVVEGESGQKIGKTKSASFINSSIILGSKFENWSYELGAKVSPKVVVLDQNEKIINGVNLEYELIHIEYQTTRRLGTGNYYYYDSKRVENSLGTCKFKSNTDFKSCDLKPKSNGSYISYVRGLDSNGRKIEVKNHTYVYGGDSYTSWNRYNHDRIDILPDKYNYKLGETAKLLIKSPFKEAKALITVERYGVISKEIVSIKGNTHVYELPIDKSYYAPGIYVSAVLLKGRTEGKVEGKVDLGKPAFKMGYVKLGVKDSQLNLKVAIKVNPKKLLPKKKVKIQIDVQDLKTKKGRFELAVAVVDEAVLQLVSDYKSRYQLFDTFYKVPNLSVLNYQSLVSLLGRQTYGKKGGTPGGGGGEEKAREDFLAVAHWEPHLITSDDGKAQLEFEVPDNLTTWKVLAVANDKTRKFGLGITDFMVTKDLIVEPVLPQFLTEGDKLNAKMVVHNKSDKLQEVKVSIEASQFTPSSSNKELKIKINEKERAHFPLTAPNEGNYELYLRAKSTSDSDAVKYLMQVIPLETNYVDGSFGHTMTSKLEVPFMLPKDAKKGSQKLEVKVSSTILGGLQESFNYVLGYPYGCWEQRMSKALYLAFYDKLKSIVGKVNANFPEPKSAVQDLLNMTPKYMGKNGGMKYYPSSYGHESPYLSTFTALAFHILEDFGYNVPKKEQRRLNSYLADMVSGKIKWFDWYRPHTINSNSAMIVDLLDRNGVSGLDGTITQLTSSFNQMSLFGKSFLISLMSRKDKYKEKAKSFLSNLLSNMDESSGKAQFVTNEAFESRYFLDTNMRSQCAMLNTLLEVDSGSEVVAKLQNFITSMRKGGRWYNTQENFFCFYSIYNYAKIYEKVEPKFIVSTELESKEVNSSKLDLEKSNAEFTVDISSMAPGAQSKINFEKKGQGRLYYTTWLKYAKAKLPTERINQGFSLVKEMFRFNESSSTWEKLGQSMKLKIGDIVKVRIQVSSKGHRSHIGLQDTLAGCFTPVNTALATTAQASKAFTTPVDSNSLYLKSEDFGWNSTFNFMEMRKTAVQFYAPKMRPGSYGIEYDMRVTASGEFTQNAPSVEEMYYPDVRGTGLGRKIVVSD